MSELLLPPDTPIQHEEQYEDGSWHDYEEEYDCYDEKIVDTREEDATIQLSLEGVL